MVMMMCLVSAAYVAMKTVDAAINWTHATIIEYAHKYKGGSVEWGNRLGLYELIAILLFEGWSLMMSIWTFMGASQLWTMVDQREKDAKTQGKFGEPFDALQAMKYVTLCMVVGVNTLIGAFALGDVADNLITWYDHYADDTKTEGDAKDTGVVDLDGTAAKHDILYHYITLGMGYMLFSVIAFGGHYFGMQHMNYLDTIECDLNLYDDATKQEMLGYFTKFTSKEACYENILSLMALIDVNKNKIVDRCEDANFMQVLDPNNTDEYVIKFSHTQPLSTWKQRCDTLFNPLWG